MKLTKIYLTVTLCAIAVVGDYIVFNSGPAKSQVFRAFSDSIVHASIGLFSALVFFSYDINITSHAWFYNVAFCTFISSFIDFDHVIVARSLQWKDLMNLKHLGIFHCTTFWLTITSILMTYSYIYKKINIYVLNWMLILAFTSHHIRDANRRGLWMYPFGHTPPLSKLLYICLICILPHIFAILYKNLKQSVMKDTVINFNTIV